jgi:hypothetical protein
MGDGDDRTNGNQSQQKPQRTHHQPYRGRAGRHDCQRIFERSISRRFESRLGFTQSDYRSFDLGEVTFELIGVRRRIHLCDRPIARIAQSVGNA